MYSETFDYIDGKLVWKVSTSRKIRIGSTAGCKQKNGYIVVRVNKKLHYAHRIIWEMFNGEIPRGMEVDHINHTRDDNRIENLRIVTRKGNCRNFSKNKSNTSGYCGVWWSNEKSKFVAEVAGSKLGYFSDAESANNAVVKYRKDNGFHENHGK